MEGLVNGARYDVAIVGGGIVGLSVAVALQRRAPGARVVLVEKEARWGAHQTGHNSGVIHSGIYYKPGSLKARFAVAGARSMVEFCRERGIRHEVCGKVIVATHPAELPRLEELHRRGVANGIAVERIGPERLRELEPHATGLAALHVPSTGIVHYGDVAKAFAALAAEAGCELRLSTPALRVTEEHDGVRVETPRDTIHARFLVNCAGLHSDRVAREAGAEPGVRIVPFRGEYFELAPGRRHLVRSLIYPVPDPSFPFLGVHLTRMVEGGVHAGPNAVLALKREGYRWRDLDVRDAAETLAFPGFWRLAGRHAREGAREVFRSLSRAAFARSLQRLVPEVRVEDLIPSHAGVRAQALGADGTLADDFVFSEGRRSLHVCNAPSPAATASIEIGRTVAARVPAALLARPILVAVAP
jgi:L-2-hydroxyglutarate oxidase